MFLSIYLFLFLCDCYTSRSIITLVLFMLIFMFKQPEYQQLIVDAGALTCLVDLLKRHKAPIISQALFSGLLRRVADAITNLAHENTNIKTLVRFFHISIT